MQIKPLTRDLLQQQSTFQFNHIWDDLFISVLVLFSYIVFLLSSRSVYVCMCFFPLYWLCLNKPVGNVGLWSFWRSRILCSVHYSLVWGLVFVIVVIVTLSPPSCFVLYRHKDLGKKIKINELPFTFVILFLLNNLIPLVFSPLIKRHWCLSVFTLRVLLCYSFTRKAFCLY